MRSEWLRLAGGLLLISACEGGFLPLRGMFEVGRDPMVVFVGGEGPSGGDLYALLATGGRPVPITFTAVGEMRPAVAPDGGAVVFLRAGSLDDSLPASVWVLNLTNGAERRIELPEDAGRPERVGWTDAGRALVISAGEALYRAAAPPVDGPARPIAGAGRAAAESALAVLLGNPVFARAVPCANGEDLCLAGDTGLPAILARGAREPARWGDDSVAYLVGDRLVVRPLGAGRARVVNWSGVPVRPRQLSMYPGSSAEPR